MAAFSTIIYDFVILLFECEMFDFNDVRFSRVRHGEKNRSGYITHTYTHRHTHIKYICELDETSRSHGSKATSIERLANISPYHRCVCMDRVSR